MFDWRRPMGRLFLALLSAWIMVGGCWGANPTMTTVADTVYRADGTAASGTLLISWPAFTTAGGQPGRMKLAEDRINLLEKSDVRRSVYDRMASASIAFLVSVAVALHDHWWLR